MKYEMTKSKSRIDQNRINSHIINGWSCGFRRVTDIYWWKHSSIAVLLLMMICRFNECNVTYNCMRFRGVQSVQAILTIWTAATFEFTQFLQATVGGMHARASRARRGQTLIRKTLKFGPSSAWSHGDVQPHFVIWCAPALADRCFQCSK